MPVERCLLQILRAIGIELYVVFWIIIILFRRLLVRLYIHLKRDLSLVQTLISRSTTLLAFEALFLVCKLIFWLAFPHITGIEWRILEHAVRVD